MAAVPKKPCTFFAKGLCKKGADCSFAHGVATTGVPNCKFGFECKRDDCKFSHPAGRKSKGDCKFGWYCKHEVCAYNHPNRRMRDTACEKCGVIPDEKCGFKHVAVATSPKNPAPLPPVSAAEVQAAVAPVAEVKIGESGNLKSLDEIKRWMEAYDGKGSDIVQIPDVKECFFNAIVSSAAAAAKQQSEITQRVISIEDEIVRRRNAGANESEINQLNAQAREVIESGEDLRVISAAIQAWVAKNRLNEKFTKAYGVLSTSVTA